MDWTSHENTLATASQKQVLQNTAVPKTPVYETQDFVLLNRKLFLYDGQTFVIPKSEQPLPIDDEYSRGYMYRYFYRLAGNSNDLVKECSADTYTSLQSNFLYTSAKTKWKIIGSQQSALSINLNIIEEVDRQLPGAKNLMSRNALLHWKDIPDIVGETDITNKLVTPEPRPEIVSGVSDIYALARQVTTEQDIILLTQDYEEIIVEDKTTI